MLDSGDGVTVFETVLFGGRLGPGRRRKGITATDFRADASVGFIPDGRHDFLGCRVGAYRPGRARRRASFLEAMV